MDPSDPSRRLLSILMPVYNERGFLRRSVERVLAAPLPDGIDRELVMVDDASNDGTHRLVEELAARYPGVLRTFRQEVNQGKGAAIRRAIEEMRGDIALFQDADLEYDPRDYPRLLEPILRDGADVVYGSRFAGGPKRRLLDFHHACGNRLLTFASNAFTGLNLTDMETCYKVFRADLLRSIPLRSNRFGLEPEVTAKIAKRGLVVYEVPISYHGRGYADGKKIGWRDGVSAFWTIVKFWVLDDCYDDRLDAAMLHDLSRARQYTRWQVDAFRPYLGERIVEIGAGIGHLSRRLPKRERLIVTDADPAHFPLLHQAFDGNELVRVLPYDPATGEGQAALEDERPDTVVCLNRLENLDDDRAALLRFRGMLSPGGRLCLMVPQYPALWGTLDEASGHRRRYTRADLRARLEAAGFRVEAMRGFNGFATPWRWLLSKVLHRRRYGRVGLKLFDTLVPILKPLDRINPLPGQSIFCVARAE